MFRNVPGGNPPDWNHPDPYAIASCPASISIWNARSGEIASVCPATVSPRMMNKSSRGTSRPAYRNCAFKGLNGCESTTTICAGGSHSTVVGYP